MLGIDDIYADPSGQLPNHLQQALKAQFLFHRDVDYVVVNGEVKIVDEFTGRIMEGRRYSEGLHQALEAKEHVPQVREENQTLATITLQNYFRLYDKLSGMTGTAMTEDAEFRQIYKLPVMSIPPNKQVKRIDEDDLIYRTVDAKFHAVADDVAERHAGRPACAWSARCPSKALRTLSRLLDKRGIKHEVLNAKNHEREAAYRRAGGSHSAPSPSPRTWRAAVPTSCSAATPKRLPTTCCSMLRPRPRMLDRGRCSHAVAKPACRRAEAGPAQAEAYDHLARNVQGRSRSRSCEPAACASSARERHESPPYRQPAARPCRPSGRPGRNAVLPVARRRPYALVRRLAHGQDRSP